MQVQSINNNYQSPVFGVKIKVGGVSKGEIKKALIDCADSKSLNEALNNLNSAQKEGNGYGNYINLVIRNYYMNVPEKRTTPFIGIDGLRFEIPKSDNIDFNTVPYNAPLSRSEIVNSNPGSYKKVLCAYNPANKLELCTELPVQATDNEKSNIICKFLTELVNINSPEKRCFWRSLELNKLDIQDEDLYKSPEVHNIFYFEE